MVPAERGKPETGQDSEIRQSRIPRFEVRAVGDFQFG
jgi:hypothetical protein